ncbi:MAG: hypothetical protein WD602_01935 [Actinomycetota bacterium]
MRFIELEDLGDERGSVHSLPAAALDALSKVRNVHLTTLKPGYVRGNHVHSRQREVILITGPGSWEFYYVEEPGGPSEVTAFSGTVTVAVEVPPGIPHAIKNTGSSEIAVLSCTDLAYDPAAPDVAEHLLA